MSMHYSLYEPYTDTWDRAVFAEQVTLALAQKSLLSEIIDRQ